MAKVEVKAKGIKNRLKAIKPYRAVAEYIWNGFDAGATSIDVRYEVDDLGGSNISLCRTMDREFHTIRLRISLSLFYLLKKEILRYNTRSYMVKMALDA
ncbi:ATP-binding protein [Pseudomonas putida]|uniref:ATP-binding protein n=1 Tax=Pseudomonas putida TaxID=303 RepID=UPI0021AB7E68|nr:ATP-binding protein [Pseudomonas putida]